jgi:hypothetical protein
MVNELRFGYNRDLNYSIMWGAFGPDLAKEIGLKNTPLNPANFSLPGFGITGYSSVGQGYTATLETINEIFQLNDNLSYHRGKHDLKVGADIRRDRLRFTGDFPSNPAFSFDGRYTGNAVADFLLGLPYFLQAGTGDSSSNFHRLSYSFYAQDNFKVNPKLTLYFGLRYEYPHPGTEVNDKQNFFDFSKQRIVTIREDGWRRSLFAPDRNNFAPRFGFAYNPLQKTVIRGGFGIYYDLVAQNESQFRGVLNPPNWQTAQYYQGAYPVQYRVQDSLPVWVIGETKAPQTINPYDVTPYVYQYNLNLQQDLKGILVEAGYVGSTGHKLNRRVNANIAPPGPGVPLADRVPYKGFADILDSTNDGWSNYNGLNFRVEKPFSKGLLLLASYTLGKHLDIGGPDEYVHHDRTGTLKDERGPAQIDSRHRLVLSYVYEFPVGKGKRALGNLSGALDKLVGGWQVTGITTFTSGHPLTPTMSGDWAKIGGRRLQPMTCVGPLNNASLRKDIRNQPTLYPYFNVENVLMVEREYMGNCGRGVIIGPGINNWDIGLIKDTHVTERVDVQFLAEFFNVWNHAQFGNPGTIQPSVNFGRIRSAGAPRDIQFGLKILF